MRRSEQHPLASSDTPLSSSIVYLRPTSTRFPHAIVATELLAPRPHGDSLSSGLDSFSVTQRDHQPGSSTARQSPDRQKQERRRQGLSAHGVIPAFALRRLLSIFPPPFPI